jgi:hypothetical protein
MDHVADPTLEVESADQLAFESSLMRPWLIANFAAFTIGFGVGGGVLRALLQPAIENAPTRMDVAWVAGTSTGAAGLALGVALGVGQWLVLRRVIRAALWWVPATCVGWVLAGFFVGFNSGGSSWETLPSAGPITPLLPSVVVLPVVIVLLSAGQWLVLRLDCLGAGWWLLVSVGALVFALGAGFVAASALPFIASTDFPSAKALVVVGAVAGPIYGYGTWLFLAQLRRRAA